MATREHGPLTNWLLGIFAVLLIGWIGRGELTAQQVRELQVRREYDSEWRGRFERKLDAVCRRLDLDPGLVARDGRSE